MTKGLTKTEYKTKTVQSELQKRMQIRDAGSAPQVGDRLKFIYVKLDSKAKGHERAEDPLYAIRKRLPIDFRWYATHHMKKPLTDLFNPVLNGQTSVLFEGEHTRVIRHPREFKGPMNRYVVMSGTCLLCKSEVRAEKAFCQSCLDEWADTKCADIEKRYRQDLEVAKKQAVDIWKGCRECAGDKGSYSTAEKCTNTDCEMFYKRDTIKHDMDKLRKTVELF